MYKNLRDGTFSTKSGMTAKRKFLHLMSIVGQAEIKNKALIDNTIDLILWSNLFKRQFLLIRIQRDLFIFTGNPIIQIRAIPF